MVVKKYKKINGFLCRGYIEQLCYLNVLKVIRDFPRAYNFYNFLIEIGCSPEYSRLYISQIEPKMNILFYSIDFSFDKRDINLNGEYAIYDNEIKILFYSFY